MAGSIGSIWTHASSPTVNYREALPPRPGRQGGHRDPSAKEKKEREKVRRMTGPLPSWRRVGSGGNQPGANGKAGQVSDVVQIQLVHDVAAMYLDRGRGNMQTLGNGR